MLKSLEDLNRTSKLAETGQYGAVVSSLSDRSPSDLSESPTLALLFGTAQARLGRHSEGIQWVEVALDRSRDRGDRAIEARALNDLGAIALVTGNINEAANYFTQALAAAEREADHTTVGRCSNNLGIINNLSGQYARAIGSYTMAIAAFQQAGHRRGIAETRPNLAITYRDQGELERALDEANRAVDEAEGVDDPTLFAQVLTVRAEIRLMLGEPLLAQHEVKRALNTHRELGNEVEEAQDLRILANTLAATEKEDEAEQILRDVAKRANELNRPLLTADTTRDLASLLQKSGRGGEARDTAQAARVLFNQLGAEAEIRKLDKAFS